MSVSFQNSGPEPDRPQQTTTDFGIIIEVLFKLLVDSLVHPVAGLLLSLGFEIAVFFDKREITVDHIPHLGNTQLIIS